MTLTAPCDWPTGTCPACADSDCPPALQDELWAWAVSDLWEATGRVYGTCEVTVLPCDNPSVVCGACYSPWRSCGCQTVSEVWLPGPVAAVVEVMVDGVPLDDTAYRIDDYEWLVRLDGGTWPTNADILDPDSFSVTYDKGVPPPAGAGQVAGMLVCSRSSCTTSGCKIPKNATQVSRQGVTMVFNLEGFGILDVDQWVANANAPVRAGAVHSPDLPKVREITWEATVSP